MSEEERQAIIHLLDKQARYEYCIKNNISFSDEDYEAYIIRQSMINKDKEIERLNNKYNKALELLIDYNLPCEVDDFMNVHSDYCETHCGVDKEQYKRCWNKYIEWKIGSDKE